uniref:Uncharacterized protein n=1 Tax=Kalanchoe fedtschenkoi TaxID=63787 RepID=A0A7N0U3E7_KALFE
MERVGFGTMLQTAPSLDVYTSTQFESGGGGEDGDLQRSVTIGDRIDALGSEDFTFGEETGMGLIVEESEVEEDQEEEFTICGPFWNHDAHTVASDLRKEAQLLMSNGDMEGAKDYFYRATVANPHDGEMLLQYAKLVWQLHRDQDKAFKYFERAALAAPENCDILGAYASFLWEIPENEDEDDSFPQELLNTYSDPLLALTNNEDYCQKMIEENSSDPLFLKTYSQFLYQSKRDLHGAEEYFPRAIQANPGDGEIMTQYAKLIWELHHDHAKALSYFERAVEIAPGDCHVAAAYASFLWEVSEGEDEDQLAQP